jgi:hypothetical protein
VAKPLQDPTNLPNAVLLTYPDAGTARYSSILMPSRDTRPRFSSDSESAAF